MNMTTTASSLIVALYNSLIKSNSPNKKATKKPSTELGRSRKMPVEILTANGIQ
jgi:hypothetical protein